MLLRLLLRRNRRIREAIHKRRTETKEKSINKDLRLPITTSQSKDVFLKTFAEHISEYIGETVTIFTGSGGQSGAGFTGILLYANSSFLRLVTMVGPPPGCSLGNSYLHYNYLTNNYSNETNNHNRYYLESKMYPVQSYQKNNYYNLYKNSNLSTSKLQVGSVADIPISKVVSFAHNAV